MSYDMGLLLEVHRGICESVKGTITLGVVKWQKSSKLISDKSLTALLRSLKKRSNLDIFFLR